MSQEPKRRHSIARKGKRRASIKLATVKSVLCKNCQSPKFSHTICANCGYYNGKDILRKTLVASKSTETVTKI